MEAREILIADRTFTAYRERKGGRTKTHEYELGTALRAERGDGAAGPYRGQGAPVIDVLEPVFIRRESTSLRRARRLGLASDVTTGDPAFDEAAFVESTSSSRTVEALLAHSDARSALLALLARGARQIAVGSKGRHAVVARFDDSYGPEAFTRPRFEAILQELARLAEALPLIREVRSVIPWGRVVLVVALFVLGVGGVAAEVAGTWRRWEAVAGTEGLAMAASGLFLLAAAWLSARRRPHALTFFMYSSIAGMGVGPLAVTGAVTVLNGMLDTPREERGQVLELRYVQKNRAYKARVALRGRSLTYDVSGSVYARLEPGSTVVVEVGDGWLGLPWRGTKIRLSPTD